MKQLIPGAVIPYSDGQENTFGQISAMVAAAGGLTLSQICAFTGLEGSTVQNWVKRGWLQPDKSKKYDERQVARVLIINALRASLPLDGISKLIDVAPLSEVELYNAFSGAMRRGESGEWRTESAVVTLMADAYVIAEQMREIGIRLAALTIDNS